MSLANEFLSGINAIYSKAGVPGTYTDRDGVVTPCSVIVDHDLSQYGEALEVSKVVATIGVRVSEVPYPPRHADTFIVAGRTYLVESTAQSNELEHTALVS